MHNGRQKIQACDELFLTTSKIAECIDGLKINIFKYFLTISQMHFVLDLMFYLFSNIQTHIWKLKHIWYLLYIRDWKVLIMKLKYHAKNVMSIFI